jgi:peptidoglycan/xylan/chitin deacetylase (PgdA/CDA1 family)
MRTLGRLARRLLLVILYRTGILTLLADWRLRGHALVLTYHRVLPLARQAHSFSSPAIIVTPATFDRHMAFLRSKFEVLRLERFMRILCARAAWPRRACLITFDDGWHDNLEFAHPILKKHGLCAVLFAAGDYIGSRATFWQEDIARRIHERWRARSLSSGLLDLMAEHGDPYALTPSQARERIWELVRRIKRRRDVELPRIVEALGSESPQQDPGEDRFLDWAELRRLEEEDTFTIASHAMSHVPLTELPAGGAEQELTRSRELLAARLRRTPAALAYPNGDYDDAVVEAARRAGFEAAFTTDGGLVAAGAPPLRIKRLNISEMSVPDEMTLLARVAGIA